MCQKHRVPSPLPHKNIFLTTRARTIRHYFKPSNGDWLRQRTGLCLLRTCKKVCEEASRVLYGENTLHFAPDDVKQIAEVLARISARNCANIRRVVLDFEQSQHNALWKSWTVDNREFGSTREQLLGVCWRDHYQYLWTGHEERFQDILDERLENSSYHCSADTVESQLTNLHDDIQPECLFDFDLNEGYPEWNREGFPDTVPPREIDQRDITKALQSLTRCTNLRQLRLVFPDPQRYVAGWRCLVDDDDLLKAFRQLAVTEQLRVEGIDDLGALGEIVDLVNVPKATATLNNSSARPHLHVEAGRPNLRAYSNWRVTKSTWKTIQFERIQTEEPPRDRISFLPRELVRYILSYVFENPDWEPEHDWENGPLMSNELAGFHFQRYAHIWTRVDIEVFPTSCYGFKNALSLIKVSKLFYHEAVDVLYRDSVFTLRIGNHGAMLKFLTNIGESNRSKIRFLCIDWAACSRKSMKYMDEETGDLFPVSMDYKYGIDGESWASSNRRNMHCLSQVFRTLTLLQCGPPLHWLLLSLPKLQRVSDFCVSSLDVLHIDRILKACARIKAQSLWLWDTTDLSRGELFARSMGASALFMQRTGLTTDEDMVRLHRKQGWEISGWTISKRLIPTSGCANGRIGVDTLFLLDFEPNFDDWH